MDIHNESPHFIGNVIITFILFAVGHWCNELQIHLSLGFMHTCMSLCKAFAYIGSGMVGVVTFLKWVQHSIPNAAKWLKKRFPKFW